MRSKAHRNQLPICIAITFMALAIFSSLLLGACATEDAQPSTPPKSHSPLVGDYSARKDRRLVGDYFVHKDGRCSYEDGSVVLCKTGVDVSDYQDYINWEAVANDGIEFAMIRIGYRGSTEGGLYKDKLFEQNLNAAQNAGLLCGVYFYSQAISKEEAKAEADFVLDLLKSRKLDYPVAFDYELAPESRNTSIDIETATDCARIFCKAIGDAGYTPILYGNSYDLRRIDLSELPNYQVWFAEYDTSPSFLETCAMWQYSSAGEVAGIDTPVDLNLDLREAL